jgi:fructose-bisphosphate aldolase class 1
MFELIDRYTDSEFKGINIDNMEWTMTNITESILVIHLGLNMNDLDTDKKVMAATVSMTQYVTDALTYFKSDIDEINAALTLEYPDDAAMIMGMINMSGGYINGDLDDYIDKLSESDLVFFMRWFFQCIIMYALQAGHQWIEHWMELKMEGDV